MAEKSHPLGGQRSHTRHTGENTVAGAITMFILSWFPEATLTPYQMTLAGIIGTAAFSALFKMAHSKGYLPGPTTVASLFLIATVGSGCAVQMGTSTPTSFQGPRGETIVACDVKGVSFAFGDASICRNVEGGKASTNFVNLTLGLVRSVAQGITGALGGAVTGLGSAVVGQPEVVYVEPDQTPVIPSDPPPPAEVPFY